MLLADVINGLDILADQLEQEAKKTTVYEVELAPGFGTPFSSIPTSEEIESQLVKFQSISVTHRKKLTFNNKKLCFKASLRYGMSFTSPPYS